MGDGSGWATLAVLGAGLAWLALRDVRRRRMVGPGDACRSRSSWASWRRVLVLVSTGLLTNLGGLQHGLLDPLLAGWAASWPARPAALVLSPDATCWPTSRCWCVFSAIAVALLVYDRRPRTDGEPSGDRGRGFLAFLGVWTLVSLVWTTIAPPSRPPPFCTWRCPWPCWPAWAIGRLVTAMAQARLLSSGGLALAWTYFLMLLAVAAVTNPVALFGGRFETLERQIQVVQAVIVSRSSAVSLPWRFGWPGWTARGALLSLALTVLVVLGVLGVHSAWTWPTIPRRREPLAPEPTSVEMRSLASDLAAWRVSPASRASASPWSRRWRIRRYGICVSTGR